MAKQPRARTLQDIGDITGVSAMTVSRVLRGSGRVKADTRDRILKIAAEFGKEPIGPLSNGSSGIAETSDLRLLVLVTAVEKASMETGESFGGEVAGALTGRLEQNGGQLDYLCPKDLNEVEEFVARRRVHGVVLRTLIPNHWLESLETRCAVIYAASHDFQSKVDAVYSNENRSAAQIYQKLQSLDHRHIMWCGLIDRHQPGDLRLFESLDSEYATERFASSVHGVRHAAWANLVYCQTKEQGMCHKFIVLERDWNKCSLDDMANQFLDKFFKLKQRPTALVVDCDPLAEAMERLLNDRGVSVPQDVSIVSYGGSKGALSGKFASIDLPMAEIAGCIPELIRRRLSAPHAPAVSMQFEAVLLDGASLGPAPN
ncbi:LacI family DNA-binding transcriptional regulator [Coraliomargarita algicola]|uniref:LacI family DNA-binding transcriptional regulator n=1 Tax=Coraliomargarita algicola TaxID=3092156 RepID=A0ABZ0RJN7_9BACT|nr:LacI family DNA-binding transcriptional regulator [Coraliomargarita sp. J2-16]WPJ96287.1 LacI family DNA-binding transcriptional regulator [Coraliomargarita sp. J2-16]